MIANSDIYYDSSLLLLEPNLSSNDVYAITRWGADGNVAVGHEIKLYANAKCSQDTWIYRNKLEKIEYMDCKFNLGVMACDNRIAYEFHINGYNVTNPCMDIMTYHFHETQYRNITPTLNGKIAYIEPKFINNDEETNQWKK